ncbi:hypothetical protein YY92_08170 [Campylobacter fetus]|uniref:hypothetical protein n=1 Tax=Campylobacter fetus TaxID=196 RepID=UPI0011C976B9|nr:hypothetical protein [Campylobacter fetus]EAJ1232636.1 hypothetical protein [Campylobacter fetus]EAK0414685.1 hypothetical protein [Campylobacter fetus]TXF09199.1 hypothetical protein FPD25_03435 [Campylobacter fetus subsp. fetus]
MINNTEIAELIIRAINKTEMINEYCNAEFKKSLILCVGTDIKNPPKGADVPFLFFEPIIKEISDTLPYYTYEFYSTLLIEGSDKPEIKKNVVRYNGIYQIETLGDLICEAIKSEINCSNLELIDCSFYHNQIDVFPIYSGTIVIKFAISNVIGDEKLILN